MFYTYILRSISHPEQRYIGSTSDLKSRLAKHNTGEVPHSFSGIPLRRLFKVRVDARRFFHINFTFAMQWLLFQ